MLNQKLNLSSGIFDDNVIKKPTRDGYGKGLVSAGQSNSSVVVLCADVSESTRAGLFQEKFPERFIEVGVAEQNMAAVAAGFGVSGKCAFISSYAVFSPGRNWEQIRTTICYNNANVKIAGSHAGLMTGPDGATHQAFEDISLTRALPNMKVIVPCDAIETEKATLAISQFYGPAYLRFAREKTPLMTKEETPFKIGQAEIFWLPKDEKKIDAAIIACGPILHNALLAAKELEAEGFNLYVLNNHTIKPIDEKTIIKIAEKSRAVVTVEDHQIHGGLGSAVAEVLAGKYPVPMEFVGVKDSFGESGESGELIEKYGLGVKNIKEAVKKVISRKEKLYV